MSTRNYWSYVSVLAFIVYFALFVTWRKLDPGGVLFYQGLVLAILVATVQLMIQIRTKVQTSAVKDAVVTLLVCYCFMFTVPTTVDRSYSVMLMMELEKHPAGMTRSQVEERFTEYFSSGGGTEKRLSEQLATGSLSKTEGRYTLTPFGHFLASSFGWFQRLFSVRRSEAAR